jgi:spoIIIJ-associated protein
MAKTKDDNIKKLQEEVNKLLDLMGTEAKAKVEKDKKNDALLVNIDTEKEAGLLIGNRGSTVSSLQTILGQIVRQQTGEWVRVLVNVADWREKESARLQDMAESVAERAVQTGEEQPIYNLTPSQRREIHMKLSEREDVVTESKGEGRERYLVVVPQKN